MRSRFAAGGVSTNVSSKLKIAITTVGLALGTMGIAAIPVASADTCQVTATLLDGPRRPDPLESPLLVCPSRGRTARSPELLPRELPDPAVPASDLSGCGDRVRRAVAGARGDQRDRDRLWPEPVGVERRGSRV